MKKQPFEDVFSISYWTWRIFQLVMLVFGGAFFSSSRLTTSHISQATKDQLPRKGLDPKQAKTTNAVANHQIPQAILRLLMEVIVTIVSNLIDFT